MLHRSGYATGVYLADAIATGQWLQEQLGRPVPGMLVKAGDFPRPAARRRVSRTPDPTDTDSTTGELHDIPIGRRRGRHVHRPAAGEREDRARPGRPRSPSTPHDQSDGVLRGIERVCERGAASRPTAIEHVMHGTTVATNTVLTGTGARVGLVTTKGYRQVLQIARSFVPGGLGGWVIYNKSLPMAPLALHDRGRRARQRQGRGRARARRGRSCAPTCARSSAKKIEALTVSLINSFANDRARAAHQRDRRRRCCRASRCRCRPRSCPRCRSTSAR